MDIAIRIVYVLAMFCTIIIPAIIFFAGKRQKSRFKKSLATNVIAFFSLFIFATAFMFTTHAEGATTAITMADSMKFIAAALAVGLSCIGSGIAVAASASSALGALSENEGIFGKAIIFVALAEGIALYGLLISFLILFS